MNDIILQYLPTDEINELYGILNFSEFPRTLRNLYSKITHYDNNSIDYKSYHKQFWINSFNYTPSIIVNEEIIIIDIISDTNLLNNKGYKEIFPNMIDFKNKNKDINGKYMQRFKAYGNDKRFKYLLSNEYQIIYHYIIGDRDEFIKYENIEILEVLLRCNISHGNLIIDYCEFNRVDINNSCVLSCLMGYNDININNKYIIPYIDTLDRDRFMNEIIFLIFHWKNEGLYTHYRDKILIPDNKYIFRLAKSAIENKFYKMICDIIENKVFKNSMKYRSKLRDEINNNPIIEKSSYLYRLL